MSVISAVLEEVLGKGPEDTVTNKREQNHGQQSQSIKTTINMFISWTPPLKNILHTKTKQENKNYLTPNQTNKIRTKVKER